LSAVTVSLASSLQKRAKEGDVRMKRKMRSRLKGKNGGVRMNSRVRFTVMLLGPPMTLYRTRSPVVELGFTSLESKFESLLTAGGCLHVEDVVFDTVQVVEMSFASI
jgi:hypothetical protein